VVSGGGLRRTELRFFCRVRVEDGVLERRERRERLWASVRDRRSVARSEAVTSADGGSPKMKNFMKAPRRRTMESWPSRRPWVKESLRCQPCVIRGFGERTRIRAWGVVAHSRSSFCRRIRPLLKVCAENWDSGFPTRPAHSLKCGQDIETMRKKFGARLRRHWCGGREAESRFSLSSLKERRDPIYMIYNNC